MNNETKKKRLKDNYGFWAFCITIIPFIIWLYLRFCIKTDIYDMAVFGLIGTFWGVFLADTLKKRAESELRKRKWKMALVMVFEDCEKNKMPLTNIEHNLYKLLNENISKFESSLEKFISGAMTSNESPQEHLEIMMNIILKKLETCHALIFHLKDYGYRALQNTDTMVAIADEKLYHKINVVYREFGNIGQNALLTQSHILLWTFVQASKMETLKEAAKMVGLFHKQVRIAREYYDDLVESLITELNSLGIKVSYEERRK